MVGANKHFTDMTCLYGKNIFCLNLIKSRAYYSNEREKELEEVFSQLIRELKEQEPNFEGVDYFHIDLKSSMKEDRDDFFEKAIQISEKQVSDHNCFELNGNDSAYQGKIKISFQRGIVRTNCVDCLDRTNLMQNLVSERAFLKQVRGCLGLKREQPLDFNPKVMEHFQDMWTRLGNQIALQYGGSKAHQQKKKKFFTKWMVSVKRHYSNTVLDEKRQKKISLFLGQIEPRELNEPYEDRKVIFKPSNNLLQLYERGELDGKLISEHNTKFKFKNFESVEDLVFVTTADEISSQAVEKSNIAVLLKHQETFQQMSINKEHFEKVIKGHNNLANYSYHSLERKSFVYYDEIDEFNRKTKENLKLLDDFVESSKIHDYLSTKVENKTFRQDGDNFSSMMMSMTEQADFLGREPEIVESWLLGREDMIDQDVVKFKELDFHKVLFCLLGRCY